MIVFDLACEQDHRFEGWFQSGEDFAVQLARGLIACPECCSLAVRRVPSALHLALPRAEAPPSSRLTRELEVDLLAGARTAYRQLTQRLLAHCEDVGANFAEEARRIHYLEVEDRSICGEATAEEFEALVDEGIDVFRLPLLKSGDLH